MQVPIDHSSVETQEDPNVTDPAERERLYWQRDHVRLYGTGYGKRLEEAGFNVLEDDYVKKLPEETVRYFALPKQEIIYFCTKA